MAEVEQELVLHTRFAGSKTRPDLFKEWMSLRAAIAEVVPITAQWLNGSFASAKIDPNDVDVLTIVDADSYDGLSAEEQGRLNSLCAGAENVTFPLCDSFLLLAYPAGHVASDLAQGTLDGFEKIFFGFDDRTGVTKGFVEVVNG